MKKTKNILFVLMALLIGFIFANCSIASSPSSSVKRAFSAAKKGDWNTVDEYLINDYGDNFYEASRSEMIGFLSKNGYLKKTTFETINDEQATVIALFEKGGEQQIHLKKHNNKWKIYIRI